jgi:hypothetical protein
LVPLLLRHVLVSSLRLLKAKTGINLCKNAILRQKRFSSYSIYQEFIISYIRIMRLNYATI